MDTFLEYTSRAASSKSSAVNRYIKTKASRAVTRSYRAVKRSKKTDDKLDHLADLLVAIKAEEK